MKVVCDVFGLHRDISLAIGRGSKHRPLQSVPDPTPRSYYDVVKQTQGSSDDDESSFVDAIWYEYLDLVITDNIMGL